MYHSVSEKHLQSCVNEYAFRYNRYDNIYAMLDAVADRTKRVCSGKHDEYSPVGEW